MRFRHATRQTRHLPPNQWPDAESLPDIALMEWVVKMSIVDNQERINPTDAHTREMMNICIHELVSTAHARGLINPYLPLPNND